MPFEGSLPQQPPATPNLATYRERMEHLLREVVEPFCKYGRVRTPMGLRSFTLKHWDDGQTACVLGVAGMLEWFRERGFRIEQQMQSLQVAGAWFGIPTDLAGHLFGGTLGSAHNVREALLALLKSPRFGTDLEKPVQGCGCEVCKGLYANQAPGWVVSGTTVVGANVDNYQQGMVINSNVFAVAPGDMIEFPKDWFKKMIQAVDEAVTA